MRSTLHVDARAATAAIYENSINIPVIMDSQKPQQFVLFLSASHALKILLLDGSLKFPGVFNAHSHTLLQRFALGIAFLPLSANALT